ncbi:sterol desaturase family protein [Rugosimonospora africana]|uniref:C-5 sterol desaturase n=1 Tax=Rugosimonospora africana TaxID=556532 RepID=A0A8J3QQB9_9ACTN|nr:sterol desaturase family protein [Rugosimonospora africana]GIH14569.1 C-5 sterol desaturase [Rugosimonospora africana]
MVDITTLAIPAYVVLMAVEAVSFRLLPDEGEQGYAMRDTATSLAMGLGSVLAGLGWGALTLTTYLFAYHLTPLRVAPSWWSWAALFVLADLTYYWQHRADHRVRILWASHVNHHSSRRYNLSTALRQSWTGIGTMPLELPMVLLGFPPAMIFASIGANLLYQFWIHTERIDKLPRPIEWVLNTPSHHRVHHATNPQYLDKNYAGVFIVWDRLFRTFEPEVEPVVYGLTKNIDTYNPVRVAFHEYAAIARDLRAVHGVRARLGILFRTPAWSSATVQSARTALAPAA